jgi:hypothetical protein
MTETPFETLKLPPTATPEEIVRRGALLCRRLSDEGARDAVRQAVRELTESDESRALQALLTHPDPAHDSPELERFQSAHRRPPRAREQAASPPLDIEEFRGLLLGFIAAETPARPLSLERVEAAESPEEIERQSAEALWQSLVAQPRG